MSDVADLAYERVKRRGVGWGALEEELVEVPAAPELGPPRPVLVEERAEVRASEQLQLWDGRWPR